MTQNGLDALARIKAAIGTRVPVDQSIQGRRGIRVHRVNHGEVEATDVTAVCSELPASAFTDARLAMIRKGSAGGQPGEFVNLKLTDLAHLVAAAHKAMDSPTPAPSASPPTPAVSVDS